MLTKCYLFHNKFVTPFTLCEISTNLNFVYLLFMGRFMWLSVKKYSLVSFSCFLMTGCISTTPIKSLTKSDPKIFQTNEKNKEIVMIMRDNKLCKEEEKDKKKCPINFYIDDFKAGTFYVNNEQKYFLQPNKYTIKVKNCTDHCETSELEIDLTNQLQKRNFTLSIDAEDRPFIIQN
jgi:hypothetical protein